MKNYYLITFLFLFPFVAMAQLNVSLAGILDYDQRINDIWGYASADGTEYALVGTNTGFSIVSLEDATNPTELFFIPGDETTWRDIKTWRDHAYVVCDNCSDGLLVVDLTDLPNSIDHHFVTTFRNGTLSTSHNIFIDEFGYAYMSGTNLAEVFFVDCFTDPFNPVFIADSPSPYAHDIYARDNLMYASEIYNGQVVIYDVSNKNNVTRLGSAVTPFQFTHNAWLSDDNNYLFTTDEKENAPVTSYDVSNPSDIKELDQFYSLESIGEGTIPHNVHVFDDYLIISYYTDGCIIVDASRPENMVEVGNFDTFLQTTDGFNGAWGAYPFLPSGKILVTDRDNGLYVLTPNYKRAAFLEGTITDAQTGETIGGATIKILEYDRDEVANAFGEYKTGIPDNGTFNIEVKRPLYEPKIVEVQLTQTEITVVDVALEPLQPFVLTLQVNDEASGAPIPFAKVRVVNDVVDLTTVTDEQGMLVLEEFFPLDTEFYAGLWGHTQGYEKQVVNLDNTGVLITLADGYEDNFALDLNWTSGGDFNSGPWELGIPNEYIVGYSSLELEAIPGEDVTADPGNFAYLTGTRQPDFLGNILGTVELTSPNMEMSTWASPMVSFHYWFFNITDPSLFGFPSAGTSIMEIFVNNGIEEIKIDQKEIERLESINWEFLEYNLKDFIEITDMMRIKISITAEGGQDITEGGVDLFTAWDAGITSVSELDLSSKIKVFPNPVSNELHLILDETPNVAEYEISNILGMKMLEGALNVDNKTINVQKLQSGAYIIRLKDERGNELGSKKFIKQ